MLDGEERLLTEADKDARLANQAQLIHWLWRERCRLKRRIRQQSEIIRRARRTKPDPRAAAERLFRPEGRR